MNSTQRNRLVLVAIFVLFLVPLVAALLLQPEQFGEDPVNTVNRGDLVQPPVPLGMEGVTLMDGRVALDETRGRWTLLHVIGEGACDARCEAAVTDLRQIHTAAGRHQDDVRVLLFGTSLDRAGLEAIDDRFLLVETLDAEPLRAADAASRPPGTATPAAEPQPAGNGTTFIVDPEGNLMLRYAPGYARDDLNKDLTKLLKWSGR